jgi:hypothetical protein
VAAAGRLEGWKDGRPEGGGGEAKRVGGAFERGLSRVR